MRKIKIINKIKQQIRVHDEHDENGVFWDSLSGIMGHVKKDSVSLQHEVQDFII